MAYIILFKELWRYAKGHRWKIILFMVLHIISTAALVSIPLIFAEVLNTIQNTETSQIIEKILYLLVIWLGAFLAFNVFHRFGRYFEFDVGYRAKQAFLNEYYKRTTQLSLKWHADHHSGDTINRINLAGRALFDFTIMQFVYIELFFTILFSLAILTYLSWQVALLSFVIAALTILFIGRFDKHLVALYQNMNEVEHKVSATLFDYISNIKTIITLRLAHKTQDELDTQIDRGYKPTIHAETWVNAWKWFTVSCCMVVQEIAVVFYYIWQQISQSQNILIGNVAAVFQYAKMLNQSFANIAREYQSILQWSTHMEAVKDIKLPLNSKATLTNDSSWQNIKIYKLNFEYEPGKQTLNDIDLSFSKGDRIALVGESGSGKSSIMAVMRGLFEPQSVSLHLDGQTFKTLSPLFETTTLIPQEPEVFENTIGYNITVGIDYAQADVMEAIRLARFDRVLERLPNGLETDVREKGVTLSGGERQRLALARGILAAKNSSIILMDEPTSSVDAHNELVIYENILEHFKDSAVISSIHRLHLLGKFDQVIVMDQGKIVQAGTFDDLKNESGLFQTLWDKYQESSKTEDKV